jgi:ABC-type molybdate transport system substrate-binding protein
MQRCGDRPNATHRVFTQPGSEPEADAKIEPRVKIIGTFPPGSHPAIVYPVAATTLTTKPEADTYLSYLHSAAAKAVFDKYGFFFLKRLIACR